MTVIGSIRKTQEVLDCCAEHRIESNVEVIPKASQQGLRTGPYKRGTVPIRDQSVVAEIDTGWSRKVAGGLGIEPR
jgi:hypothetical protein